MWLQMLRTHKGKLRPFNWMAFFFNKVAVNIDGRILKKNTLLSMTTKIQNCLVTFNINHTLKFFQFWWFRKILCEKLIHYFEVTYFSHSVLSKTLRTSIIQVGKFHWNSEVQILYNHMDRLHTFQVPHYVKPDECQEHYSTLLTVFPQFHLEYKLL